MPKKGGSIRKRSNRTRKVRKGGTKRGNNNIIYAEIAHQGNSTGNKHLKKNPEQNVTYAEVRHHNNHVYNTVNNERFGKYRRSKMNNTIHYNPTGNPNHSTKKQTKIPIYAEVNKRLRPKGLPEEVIELPNNNSSNEENKIDVNKFWRENKVQKVSRNMTNNELKKLKTDMINNNNNKKTKKQGFNRHSRARKPTKKRNFELSEKEKKEAQENLQEFVNNDLEEFVKSNNNIFEDWTPYKTSFEYKVVHTFGRGGNLAVIAKKQGLDYPEGFKYPIVDYIVD